MHGTVVGSGYVGLVSGTCFADFGHDVVCVDKDWGKIDALKGTYPVEALRIDVAADDKVGCRAATNNDQFYGSSSAVCLAG